MTKYILQRIVLMVGIILGVMTITFVLSRLLPSSPAELMLGGRPSAEQIAAVEAELGLDKSIPVQYVNYIRDISRGDFGKSLRTGQPVLTEIRNRIGATFELTTISIVFVILIGVPLGILSAVRQNSWLDNIVRAIAVGGVAMPSFILAMVLQMIFYGSLGWLPLQGRLDSIMLLDAPIETITGLYLIDAVLTGNWDGFVNAFTHLILPVLTLVVLLLATVMRITRNTMVEVLKEEYIRTAFAYGVSKTSIYYRHALKATLIPMLTVIGLTYGQLLGGTVIVEFIFNWPGLGGFLVSSIIDNDFPAVVGTTLLLAGIYLTVNLIIDLLYFVVDPRFRAQ